MTKVQLIEGIDEELELKVHVKLRECTLTQLFRLSDFSRGTSSNILVVSEIRDRLPKQIDDEDVDDTKKTHHILIKKFRINKENDTRSVK